jgi:DEAD/DEAH box helicase domain-containing protein
MLLMADLRDIDRCIGDKSGEWFVRHQMGARSITSFSDAEKEGSVVGTDAFDPTLFIFDAYPGGVGFSDLLYRKHDHLLRASRSRILSCPCSSGCPSCVGPTLEVGISAKKVASAILDLIIGDR